MIINEYEKLYVDLRWVHTGNTYHRQISEIKAAMCLFSTYVVDYFVTEATVSNVMSVFPILLVKSELITRNKGSVQRNKEL